MNGHRSDIDGLRAIAVIFVVAYHVDIGLFSGGYVGVDVFFVISGFLITAQIDGLRSLPTSELLSTFYQRRARRILPALTLVLVATIGVAALVLLPSGEQQRVGKSGLASALFVSNEFFRGAVDYFEPSGGSPLLHTWSLSVEEQFYLVWPAVLAIVWRLSSRGEGRRPLIITVVCVTAASFAWSVDCAFTSQRLAFFGVASRLWELGAGAFLALTHDAWPLARRLPPTAEACGGMILLTGAAMMYGAVTPYPGIAALAPVVGTCLLLDAGRRATNNPVATVLATRPLQFIGTVSYAWYLWHWPLLTIGRTLDLERHSRPRDLVLVIIAFAIAAVSTLFIELPIRRQLVWGFRTARQTAVASVMLVVVSATSAGLLWKHAHDTFARTFGAPTVACSGSVEATTAPVCTFEGGTKAHVYLVGDSHAAAWSPMIFDWAARSHIRLAARVLHNCEVLLEAYARKDDPDAFGDSDQDECRNFANATIQGARRDAASGIRVSVVVGAAWITIGQGSLPRATIASRLDAALDSLGRSNIRVLIIGPTPVFPFSAAACIARASEERCRLPRGRYDSLRAGMLEMLGAAALRHSNLELWDPAPLYCDTQWCRPMRAGQLMFYDDNHLTAVGARSALSSAQSALDRLLPVD